MRVRTFLDVLCACMPMLCACACACVLVQAGMPRACVRACLGTFWRWRLRAPKRHHAQAPKRTLPFPTAVDHQRPGPPPLALHTRSPNRVLLDTAKSTAHNVTLNIPCQGENLGAAACSARAWQAAGAWASAHSQRAAGRGAAACVVPGCARATPVA